MHRAFQMSRSKLIILVEGREVDGYLYARIGESMLGPANVPFRVVRADEVSGGASGGKGTLLSFFQYLVDQNALDLQGGYATLFCLDKDLDDLDRVIRRSDHIFYTRTYDIEGTLALNADLSNCAAAAMSVPPATTTYLSPAGAWCDAVKTRWAEWVALCLFARSCSVELVNYRMLSTVNQPLHGMPNPGLVSASINAIAGSSGIDGLAAQRRYKYRLQRFRRKNAEGTGDEWFKGKWYLDVLASELVATFPGGGRTTGTVRSALQALLLQSADVMGTWSQPLRQLIETRLSAIGS